MSCLHTIVIKYKATCLFTSAIVDPPFIICRVGFATVTVPVLS